MDTRTVAGDLRRFLAERAGRVPEAIASGDRLLADLRIDEDDASEVLIPQLERHFGFQATRREWRQVVTVGDLEHLIARLAGQVRPEVAAERATLRRQTRLLVAGGAAWIGLGIGAYAAAPSLLPAWQAASFLTWLGIAVPLAYRAWRTRRQRPHGPGSAGGA